MKALKLTVTVTWSDAKVFFLNETQNQHTSFQQNLTICDQDYPAWFWKFWSSRPEQNWDFFRIRDHDHDENQDPWQRSHWQARDVFFLPWESENFNQCDQGDSWSSLSKRTCVFALIDLVACKCSAVGNAGLQGGQFFPFLFSSNKSCLGRKWHFKWLQNVFWGGKWHWERAVHWERLERKIFFMCIKKEGYLSFMASCAVYPGEPYNK